MYIYIHAYVHTNVYIYTHMHRHMHKYVCIYKHINSRICVYIHIYTCTTIHMYKPAAFSVLNLSPQKTKNSIDNNTAPFI